VGDVIMLEAGDRVPADCLLIEEMDMHVDQRMYNLEDDLLTQRNEGDAQRDYTEKQCSYQEAAQDASSNPDNLLLQESIVMQGSGKAVVLCVGKRTLREVELSDDTDKLKIEDVETPYQAKLKTFSEVVGFYAQVVGYGSLVLFGIVWLFTCMFTSGLSIYDGVGLEKLVNFAIISMSLLIVCIPEGMPLVISMAMAFSVDSLQEEHLLIKNLDALETSGQLVDILTGKTATLTEGDLIVGHLHIIGMPVDPKEPAVNNEVMSILYQCMILNTDAHLQMGEQEYAPHGNPVDVGLMNLLVEHN
jgi:P-type Ca2+ transporter type 2C